jgi:hypothetical protein
LGRFASGSRGTGRGHERYWSRFREELVALSRGIGRTLAILRTRQGRIDVLTCRDDSQIQASGGGHPVPGKTATSSARSCGQPVHLDANRDQFLVIRREDESIRAALPNSRGCARRTATSSSRSYSVRHCSLAHQSIPEANPETATNTSRSRGPRSARGRCSLGLRCPVTRIPDHIERYWSRFRTPHPRRARLARGRGFGEVGDGTDGEREWLAGRGSGQGARKRRSPCS